jgi:hypothetical protein
MRIRGRNRGGQTYFFRFQGLFNNRGVRMPKSSTRISASKGDGCMKDTNHPIRHPRVHLGDRAKCPTERKLRTTECSGGPRNGSVLGCGSSRGETLCRSMRRGLVRSLPSSHELHGGGLCSPSASLRVCQTRRLTRRLTICTIKKGEACCPF